jgi:hypothetical protein
MEQPAWHRRSSPYLRSRGMQFESRYCTDYMAYLLWFLIVFPSHYRLLSKQKFEIILHHFILHFVPFKVGACGFRFPSLEENVRHNWYTTSHIWIPVRVGHIWRILLHAPPSFHNWSYVYSLWVHLFPSCFVDVPPFVPLIIPWSPNRSCEPG